MLCPDGFQSGRRDSNPRMSAWKADALPLGDSRIASRFCREPGFGSSKSVLREQAKEVESGQSMRTASFPPPLPSPRRGEGWVGGTPAFYNICLHPILREQANVVAIPMCFPRPAHKTGSPGRTASLHFANRTSTEHPALSGAGQRYVAARFLHLLPAPMREKPSVPQPESCIMKITDSSLASLRRTYGNLSA